MKKLFTGVFVLMVLLSMAISAEAFDSKSIYRDDGLGASASWYEYNDGVDSGTYIYVTETDDGTDVYVNTWTHDQESDVWTDSWGFLFTTEDVFTVDKKLESATLSIDDFVLTTCAYDPEMDYTCTDETVSIKAEWTGKGKVMKSSSKYISKYVDFMSKYSDNTWFREATATGSIGKEELGTSDFAELIKFKSVSMYMEK